MAIETPPALAASVSPTITRAAPGAFRPLSFAPAREARALKGRPVTLAAQGVPMRPPLPAADRRTRRKVLLFSPAEWLLVEQRARECQRTPNAFIRECAVGAVPRTAAGASHAPLVRQLARLGMLLRRSSGPEHVALLDEVRAVLARV